MNYLTMKIRLIIYVSLLIGLLHASTIKSITGNIMFDSNKDGIVEAKLSTDGLAIGPNLTPSANFHLLGDGIVTGNLVVGGETGVSTLEIQGSVGYNLQTVSSNVTLSDNSVVMIDTSSDNLMVTLPYAGNVRGRQYTLKKISNSNQATIEGGGNLIDQYSTFILTSGNNGSLKVISNGFQWYVLHQSNTGVSTSGSWTPAQIATQLWFDASDVSTITESGGAVSQWDDKSGNDYHATQATAAQKPTTNSRTINGLNALEFFDDAGHRKLSNNSLALSQGYSVFGVVQDDGLAGYHTWWSGLGGGARSFASKNSGGNRTYWASSSIIGTAMSANVELWSVIFNGASSTLYVDGSLDASGNPGSNGVTSGFYIGSESGAENVAPWDGLIAEVIVIDSAASTETRQLIEGYLAHKWGQQGNLPPGHPYKEYAP